jgi:hypothetical protein
LGDQAGRTGLGSLHVCQPAEVGIGISEGGRISVLSGILIVRSELEERLPIVR